MRGSNSILAAAFCVLVAARLAADDAQLEAAKRAFEKGEYGAAVELLKSASAKEPGNGDIHLWLTKSYLEMNQHDAAVSSAERAVAIDPRSSVYHRWLGQAYGQKADHTSPLSALPLARKTQKEFQTAVQLDERNFDAVQDLIEFDCTAPSLVGGGEDKAQPLIQKLLSLDPAEGHYGVANCRAKKKDFASADAEFMIALENKLKSPDRIYDIGDYFARREQAEKLVAVADAGQSQAPGDPRANYYRAVAWILKGERLSEAEKFLRGYIQAAPIRSTFPKLWHQHYWLGRLCEAQNNPRAAKDEYQAALKFNPKFKPAQDALKKLDNP